MAAVSRSFASRYGASISWFPGHMMKATRQLEDMLRGADVLLEVRDARLPFSSANPMLDAISNKPRVVVFNKADLANDQLQQRTTALVKARGHEAVFTSATGRSNVGKIFKYVDALQTRSSRFRTAGVVMFVAGIPNVGKSSLINAAREAGRCVDSRGAVTAPIPGVTRNITAMKVRKNPPLYLFDTPGILMPRIDDVETGLKLSVCGAVREAAVPAVVQAEYLLYLFTTLNSTRYVQALQLSRTYDETEAEACLSELAGRLKLVRPGGGADMEGAARHLVRAFQEGTLGRYTLDYLPAPS